MRTLLRISFMLMSFMISEIGLSAVHIGGAFGHSYSYLGYQEQSARSYKGTLGLDLGAYFRINYSYKHAYQHLEGYKDTDDSENVEVLVYSETDATIITHSLELFIVLYAGNVFTPFVFVGAGYMDYKVVEEVENEAPRTDAANGPTMPVGAGLSIRLSEDFSLKLTNTWTSTKKKEIDGSEKPVRNTEFEIGLSYKID